MPIVTKTVDAIYLGDFADMSAGFPTGQDARNDVTGTYGVQGSGAPDIGTVQELTVTGNEDFAPGTSDNDFSVDRNSTTQGIAEGSGPQQQVTYIDQSVLVTFQTASGSFTANMTVFQLADGSVYMMENPAEAPGSSFRFSNAVAGREVTEFSVPSLGTTSNGFPVIEEPWAADAFPPSPDGVVDGEETGETMGVGYNDNNAPSNGGGDEITTGDDSIMGNGGDDTIDGGAGNDSISGGRGADSILGGDGNDTIEGDGAESEVIGNDFSNGDWSGSATLNSTRATFLTDNASTNAVTTTPTGMSSGEGAGGGAQITLDFIWADGSTPATSGSAVFYINYDGINYVQITTPADGTEATISYFNGATGPTGPIAEGDAINGTGFTTLTFDLPPGIADSGQLEFLADTTGGEDNFSIDNVIVTRDGHIPPGNDTIDGGAGSDTIYGGAGDDSLDGGTGDDTIDGGTGSDTFLLNDNFGDDIITGGEDPGGLDIDTIDASGITTGGVTVNVTDESGSVVQGSDSADFSEIENFILTDQNDSFTAFGTSDVTVAGGAGDDTFQEGNGTNTLFGGDGDDTFEVGFGTSTIDGGTGADTLSAVASDDPISVTFTGTGSGTYDDLSDSDSGTFSSIEAVQGSSGADSIDGSSDGGGLDLAGGAGSDTIYGGSGNDTIDGGDDADTLVGGGGADSISGGAGDDVIVGGNNAGAFPVNGDMAPTGADTLDGGDGNDTIYGNTGEDVIFGGAGSDLLLGEWGDDSISGGADNDTLDGGADNDTLDGGEGSDVLTGGSGADVFIADGTADTITDFDTTTGIDGGGSGDNDFVDLTGFYNQTNLDAWNAANPGQTYATPLGWLRADQADGTLGEAGDLVIARDNAAVAPSELNAENTGVVCYASGTLIKTLRGDVPIENLQIGDHVITRDNGPQQIIWAGRKTLTSSVLSRTPKLKPIRLSARFFDLDRDLIVSPQHGIVLRDAQRGGTEKLYRATHLADLTGGAARRMLGCQHVTYHHLMFASHQTISANGMWSESLYPGKMALSAMPDDSFQEIISLFPDLRSHSVKATYGAPAIDYARRRGLPETLHDLAKAG